ncbi:MAG: hypothetical protein MJZ57_05365, partial [Bacteroidales bacterium]|nr:hypothetical protein [Bacteroidales bacterium]
DMDRQRQTLLSAKQQLESEKSKLECEKQNLEQVLQQLKVQVSELESAKAVVVPNPNEFSVQQGLTEDVDLFFDLDHESYGPEVEHVEKNQPVSEPKVETPVQPKPVAESKQTVQPTVKPAEVIDSKQVSDEDDLLQFIPSAKKSQPVEQPVAPKEKSQSTSVATSKAAPMEQSSAPRSLNDLFNAQKEDRSLGAQFQHAKVGDLTKAISINDKFTYIKELFNGRGEEFSASIQKLNQCANMEDAFTCLEGLKKQYYWDSSSTAYLSLCDLLRRKYM